MPIEYKQFRSSPDPEDGQPWYELDVDLEAREVTVIDDRDGGTEFDMTDVRSSIDDVDVSQPARMAVTEDGQLIAYNLDDHDVPPLRAHLADWDGDDTLTVLEFVEE